MMLADQKEQLRLHAEAVQRHEERARLRLKEKEDAHCDSGARGQAESSSSSSVAQLSDAVGALSLSSSWAEGSSSSAATALSSASSAISASAASAAACSWTAAHSSLESLRAPGRKKYGTIMKVALRFLHSLRPVTVNRSGCSHVVFHFSSGRPVTLVQLHAGGRSKDGTKSAVYCTRLYQSLHQAALQRLGMTALPTSAATEQRRALPPASSSAAVSSTAD
jgi:hypothetical protein